MDHLRRYFCRESADAFRNHAMIGSHNDNGSAIQGRPGLAGYPCKTNNQLFQFAQTAGRFCQCIHMRRGFCSNFFIGTHDPTN